MKPDTLAVLRLLRSRGAQGVTPWEGRVHVGTDRLAARVWELRQAGYPVVTQWERDVNGSRYARYRLTEK